LRELGCLALCFVASTLRLGSGLDELRHHGHHSRLVEIAVSREHDRYGRPFPQVRDMASVEPATLIERRDTTSSDTLSSDAAPLA